MDGFQTSCPGQRVTDTVFTDLTQHLALPVTYAPDRDGNVCAALAAKDRPLSDSRPLVQKVVQLLNATNTTYLRLRSTPHFQGSHGGPLRKELERAAPGVFGIGYDHQAESLSGCMPQSLSKIHGQEPRPAVESGPEVRSPDQKRKRKGTMETLKPPPQFQASQDSHELDKVSDFTHKEELKLDVMHGASANQSARVERQMETVTKAIHRQMVEQGHVRLEESQMTMQAESMAEANLAESFSKVVARMIEKSKTIEGADICDGNDAVEVDYDIDLQDLRKHCLPMEDLKALNVECMRAADYGVLKDVLLDDLVEIIALMHNHVKVGCGVILDDEDDETSSSFGQIMIGAEACLAILHIMTADGLSVEVFNEDAIESVLEFVNYHLKYNVYVFYDIMQRQKFRPLTYTYNDEQPAAKKTKLGKKRAGVTVSSTAKLLTARLENVMGTLQHLFSRVAIQGSQVSTLVNVVMQVLTIEDLHVLQFNAISLLVNVFQEYPDQRKVLVESFISSILFNAPMGRSARKYMIPSEDEVHILPVSAVILQLVQVACCLPTQDGDHGTRMNTFAPSVTWADAIWNLVFDRLPRAKAQKSDTEYDMRALVEMVICDIMTVLHLPDWPGASTLLLRFVTVLGGKKGLQYPDGSVRQACVDLLGQVASRLSAEIKAADEDTEWVEGLVARSSGRPYVGSYGKPLLQPAVLEGDEKADALCVRGQWLLLDFLLRGPPAYFPAAMFHLCRMFSEEMRELVRGDEDEGAPLESDVLVEEQGAEILAKYRQMAGGQIDAVPCQFQEGMVLGRAAACHVSRYLFKRSALGKGFTTMIKWIIDMLDRNKQVPGTRAKAVKALGLVVEADTRLLAMPEVKTGINRSLHDESISVREAAVDLLGRHIGTDVDLAMAFFDLIGQAAVDSGTSVRKRAVKILWESCIRIQNFPRATEACIRVLQRISDPEESIHALVRRIFHDLWFSAPDSGSETALNSPVARAHQLADVAISVYEGTSNNIHLPLETSHPLVAVVMQAVQSDPGSENIKSVEYKQGSAIASALLEEVLCCEEAIDAEAPAEHKQACSPFPFLLALHAFALAEARLIMPHEDPVKFLRQLSPYLKVTGGSVDSAEVDAKQSRRSAEQIICILHIVNSLMHRLICIPRELVDDLLADLTSLIQRHKFVQVVAAACRCLGSLASMEDKSAKHTIKVSLAVFSKLKMQLRDKPSECTSDLEFGKWCSATCRLLYTLGQLCRYAADVLDNAREAPLPMEQALNVILCLFSTRLQWDGTWCLRLKENALQAAGAVFIAKPTLMIHSVGDKLVSEVLGNAAHPRLRMRGLSNLSDLLKSEEERLLSNQKAGDSQQREYKQLASPGVIVTTAPLQTQNGQGDGVSLASGIIQRYWDRVLNLATDISGEAGSAGGSVASSAIRQQALELIEEVLCSGLVAPWTAVPRLVALATDPTLSVATRARRILRQESEKHASFFDGRVAEGIEVTFRFHKSLALESGRSIDEAVPDVVKGLSQLYSGIIQHHRSMKINFLSTILKKFELAVEMDPETAAPMDMSFLNFLANVAGSLPYRRADEPLSILHSINGIISRRAEFVRSALKSKLQVARGNLVQISSTDASNVLHDTAHAPPKESRHGHIIDGPARIRQDIQMDQGMACQATKDMLVELKAAYSVSILLQLKLYIRTAYRLDGERIAQFSPFGEKRKNEERNSCSRSNGPVLALNPVPVEAFSSLQHAADVYNTFKCLMANDSADYGEGVTLHLSKKARRAMEALQNEPASAGREHNKKGRGRSRKSAPI